MDIRLGEVYWVVHICSLRLLLLEIAIVIFFVLLLDRCSNVIWRRFGINFVVIDLLDITINLIRFTIAHP